MIRSKRNNFTSLSSYITLLLWPALTFLTTFFTYKSFDITILSQFGIDSYVKLLLFLMIGTMAYNCYWSMVQEGLRIENERKSGIIEIIFLSPVNRMAIVYGRSLSGLLQSLWTFAFFSLIIFVNYGLSIQILLQLLISFIILVIGSVVWGGLINAMFLISRNIDMLFTIFSSPMEFFSGVNFPTAMLPLGMKFISALYPLSYSIYFIRNIFFSRDWAINPLFYIGYILLLFVLIKITHRILVYLEAKNKNDGSFFTY